MNAPVSTAPAAAITRAVAERVRERLRDERADPVRDPQRAATVARAEVRRHNDYAFARGVEAIEDEAGGVRDVLALVSGYGPLQPLLDDPSIEEVWINAPDRVFFARDGRSARASVALTAEQLRDLVERMLQATGRRVDLSQPFVDASLPDGSRLHVVIPDITREHWSVNIRKFVPQRRSLAALIDAQALPPALGEQLVAALRGGRSILVSGATHTGNTTWDI